MSNLLEDYLHQFRSQLKDMPAERREAEVEEARQHLLALIQQRIKTGEVEELATSTAIQQFGSAQDNGKAIYHALYRQGALRFVPLAHTLVVVAMVCLAVAHLEYGLSRNWVAPSPFLSAFVWSRLGPPVLSTSAGTSGFTIAGLGLYVFCGILGVLSLVFPRTLRTLFCGSFAILMAFNIAIDISILLIAPRTSFNQLIAGVPCVIETLFLGLSSFCVITSIKRDNSIMARSKTRSLS